MHNILDGTKYLDSENPQRKMFDRRNLEYQFVRRRKNWDSVKL